MSRLFIATLATCSVALMTSGCAVQQTCLSHHHQDAPAGWVTITGTAIPATTTPVDENGKSLVNCLLDSRVVDILNQQHKSRANSVAPAFTGTVLQSDTAQLLTVLKQVEQAKDQTVVALYGETTREVEALQLTYPQLLTAHSDAIDLKYAFASDISTPQDRVRLAAGISAIEDDQQRDRAVAAFRILDDGSTAPLIRAESLQVLNELARSGRLKLDSSQRARSWSYQTVSLLVNQRKLSGTDGQQTAASDPALTATGLLQSLVNATGGSTADAMNGTADGTGPTQPGDTIFAIIEQQSADVVIVPLDSIFESPVGGLWLFPGDQIQLTRLADILMLSGQTGNKRIGLTGLVAKRGIIQTEATKLRYLLNDVSDQADIRSNMLIVHYPIGTRVAKLVIPYSVDAQTQPAMQRIEQLSGHIGLIDGTVLKLDHSDISPLLKRSRQWMQAEAEARAAQTRVQLCSTSHIGTGLNDHTPAKVTVPSQTVQKPKLVQDALPTVPVLSGACDALRRTGQGIWPLSKWALPLRD